MYQVYIDTIQYDEKFLIAKNKKNQIGFETYINIKTLSEGKHLFKVKTIVYSKKDTLKVTEVIIPFWHFKQ